MNRTCTNCRYYDLPTDAVPCKQCDRCSTESEAVDKWACPIKDITDDSEKIEALCELQMYTMLSMAELREQVDYLTNIIKER